LRISVGDRRVLLITGQLGRCLAVKAMWENSETVCQFVTVRAVHANIGLCRSNQPSSRWCRFHEWSAELFFTDLLRVVEAQTIDRDIRVALSRHACFESSGSRLEVQRYQQ
jgi:hypothetical protein